MLRGGKPPLERCSINITFAAHPCPGNYLLEGSSPIGQLPLWTCFEEECPYSRDIAKTPTSVFPKADPQFGNKLWLSNRLPGSVAEGSQFLHITPYICMFRGGKPPLKNNITNIRQLSSTLRLKSSLHLETIVSRPSSTPRLKFPLHLRSSYACSKMEVPIGGGNADITFLLSENQASEWVWSFHNMSQARFKQLVHFRYKITYNYISLNFIMSLQLTSECMKSSESMYWLFEKVI